MVNIEQLEQQIAAKRAAYHEGAESMTPAAERALSQEIKELQTALTYGISDGAGPCPYCGERPIGVHKRANEFEVGCPICPIRARAGLSEGAVKAWNAGDFYDDDAYKAWVKEHGKR